LLDAVWPDVAVTEDVLRLSARELRSALGDEPKAPRFIQTVPRLGYRFIATMGPAAVARSAPVDLDDDRPTDRLVVGRERERAEIAAWLGAATGGRRQLGFVTGDAGIGKTTLVDVALRDFRRTPGTHVRIARGQCIEQYGGGEPYLPMLQAIVEFRKGSAGCGDRASAAPPRTPARSGRCHSPIPTQDGPDSVQAFRRNRRQTPLRPPMFLSPSAGRPQGSHPFVRRRGRDV